MTTMGPAEATASARELRKLLGSPQQRRHFLLAFRPRSAVLRVQRRPFKPADVAQLRRAEGYPLAIRGEVVWAPADGVLHFRSPQAPRAAPRWSVFKKVLAREFPAFKRCQLADAVLEKAEQPQDEPFSDEAAFIEAVSLDDLPDELHGLEGSPAGLRFDRGDELLPGSRPPLSFHDALLTLSDPSLDEAAFQWLNGLLADAWAAELDAGVLPKDTSFQSYKLQFLQLDVPGHGPMPATEWGLLHIKAADLPDTPQCLTLATVSWVDASGSPQQLSRRIALPASAPTADAARAALAAEGWPADGLDITLHEVVDELPAAEDVLAELDTIPASTLRALLSSPAGTLEGPDGAPLDIRAPEVLLDLQDIAAPLIRNLVVGAVFQRWSDESGAAVGGLLSEIPDPSRLLLQPTPNAELPGKCAPLSAANATICGIGSAAREGLLALQADGSTRLLAEELSALLHHSPMDAETRGAIHDTLVQLRGSAPRAMRQQVDAVERMVSAVLDRLQPDQDEHGPFFEMTFSIPHSPATRGLQPGPRTIKLRAEDLQSFNEEIRSPDPYPGARQPLRAFFSDPRTLSGLGAEPALGAGLIAAGLDKALRASGSQHGLIYGTAPEVVGSMLHNQEQRAFHINLDAGPERAQGLLRYGQANGGGMTARLGTDAASGHAAPVLGWGAPLLDGAPVSAETLADCTADDPERIRRGLHTCAPLRALGDLADDALPDAVAEALRARLSLDHDASPEQTALLLDVRGALRVCALRDGADLGLSGLTVTTRR